MTERAAPSVAINGIIQRQNTLNSASAIPDPVGVKNEYKKSNLSGLTRPLIDWSSVSLTGKQEHYLKRELISQQVRWEIEELSSPTALQRFGAPFCSDAGEVAPQDSELPILRYIFVHHVRNFPFLDRAKEKEFWQNKLQVFLESFANKHISSSEDRLEETKRRKLSVKAQKLVELMMVSGIPTSSGYEERITFSEMEVVERGASEIGLMVNVPHGHKINDWDVNVAGVRIVSVKSRMRYHQHPEFLISVKHNGKSDHFVSRRYRDFVALQRRIRQEIPGKNLPPLPRKMKTNSFLTVPDDNAENYSLSSSSTQDAGSQDPRDDSSAGSLRSYIPFNGNRHKRSSSTQSQHGVAAPPRSPRNSDGNMKYREPTLLYREQQRISLRAFLRTLLHNEVIAKSAAMEEFLNERPLELDKEEIADIERRVAADETRVLAQRRLYEIARQRAANLDVHMEAFRREIVERNGLSRLFQEIRVKNTIQEMRPEYQKFAEWLRIEVAATIYHLFLAEDNSPELFSQAKRIHSLIPYTVLKNVIRITNPAAVMSGVLGLFLAQPFGARSLMQRIFGMAIHDGIRAMQRAIETLSTKIGEPEICEKIKNYVEAEQRIKENIRREAKQHSENLVVVLLRDEELEPVLESEVIAKIFNAYVVWDNDLENVDEEMRIGAQLFGNLKQLLKLNMRLRDKVMMLQIIEEPSTLQLFSDLFTIFYEPLVRVYKSANVYSSITDFAHFMDDIIETVDSAQRKDASADPNETVQTFIDLCSRHENNFYKFVHEVHLHDDGLFDRLMSWLEGILTFLRLGPRGENGESVGLDMNLLVKDAIKRGDIQPEKFTNDIDTLMRWQRERKKWHRDKTRQKMAQGEGLNDNLAGFSGFTSSDFGINEIDLEEMELEDNEHHAGGNDMWFSDEEDDNMHLFDEDPISAERKHRQMHKERLRSSAGEPIKPELMELRGLGASFLGMLKGVLAKG